MSAQSLVDTLPTLDTESGYASGDSNDEHNLNLFFTKSHLKYLNSRLSALEPEGMQFHDLNQAGSADCLVQKSYNGV